MGKAKDLGRWLKMSTGMVEGVGAGAGAGAMD
jgi:hypothetical protein